MLFRKIVSLSIALSFVVLATTGIISYFQEYTRITATLHTIFGFVFSFGVLFHLFNNLRPITNYFKHKVVFILVPIALLVFLGAYFQTTPFSNIMNWGTKLKANSEKEIALAEFEVVEMNLDKELMLTIDLLKSRHYWHPQMAIWVEDTTGKYIETLFVSKATAEGLFFGGRSKENFKSFDEKDAEGAYRRVNALPIWSHQRNVKYDDGMVVPTRDKPLPDAISGATLAGNFNMSTSTDLKQKFFLKIELNVAFDDNEFYSEYDFPDDSTYHNGTGQLGQPSILFSSFINPNDDQHYYLMDLIGHGHHSGQDGKVYDDLSKLTTAKEIVERIVVGVHQKKKGP